MSQKVGVKLSLSAVDAMSQKVPYYARILEKRVTFIWWFGIQTTISPTSIGCITILHVGA